MRVPLIALCCATAFMFAIPARADSTGDSPAPPSPEAVAPSEEIQQLAARYVKESGVETVLRRMVVHFRQQAVQAWTARTHGTIADMDLAWHEFIQPEFDARIGIFTEGITQVFAQNYNADELRALIAFEESDLGTKVRALRPKVQDEMFRVEQRFLSDTASDAIKQHIEELRKLGLTFSQ
jgi:hypothetical protein